MGCDRGNDLTPELRRLLSDRLEAVVRESAGLPEGVWFTVHDDRSRAVDAGVRDLGSGAAAVAQELLKAADELMRMAGNAQHNSPNGFDKVARGVLQATLERLAKAQREVLRYQGRLHEWVDRGGWEGWRVKEAARRELIASGEVLSQAEAARLMVSASLCTAEEAEDVLKQWRESQAHGGF